VSFNASAILSNCSGSAAYDWNFGDGSAHSLQQSPSHTYTTANTYTWTLTVSANGASPCVKTGTIAISPLAKTSTGFYYPVNVEITDDANWNACGATYYTDTRHIGADLFYDSAPHNNDNNIGKPVYAISKGTVFRKSGPSECSGWGIDNYALAIQHSSTTGDFIAVYGHIRTNLNVGDQVSAGEQVGTIGDYQEHTSYKRDKENKCQVSGDIVTRSAHLHFGVFPSTNKFPSSEWGRIKDNGCKHPDSTNGFVNPLEWIRVQVAKN
jgi:PKD repeat protein